MLAATQRELGPEQDPQREEQSLCLAAPRILGGLWRQLSGHAGTVPTSPAKSRGVMGCVGQGQERAKV